MYSRIGDPQACTLTDALREWASNHPDQPWLEDSQGSQLTVGQAYAGSQRFAGFLHQLGVQPEERVGVFMTNSCATATTVFGIGMLRGTAVMLNTELRSSFLRHQLNDCQLATMVASWQSFNWWRKNDERSSVFSITAVPRSMPMPNTVVAVAQLFVMKTPTRSSG